MCTEQRFGYHILRRLHAQIGHAAAARGCILSESSEVHSEALSRALQLNCPKLFMYVRQYELNSRVSLPPPSFRAGHAYEVYTFHRPHMQIEESPDLGGADANLQHSSLGLDVAPEESLGILTLSHRQLRVTQVEYPPPRQDECSLQRLQTAVR